MKTTSFASRVAGTVLALAGVAAPAAADQFEAILRALADQPGVAAPAEPAFGLGQQAMVVPVLDYMPIADTVQYGHRAEGYVFASGAQNAVLWTALKLPAGADLDAVCFDYIDTNAGANLIVGLIVAEAARATSPAEFASLAGATTAGAPSAGQLCLAPAPPHAFPFRIRTTGDATNDGDSATLQYFVIMSVPPDFNTANLGALTLRWRRNVSPAPGTARFNDIPTGHPLHPFVEALAASGVTGGCGGGNYCPNDPLTRGQMAVFLSAALGLHWAE